MQISDAASSGRDSGAGVSVTLRSRGSAGAPERRRRDRALGPCRVVQEPQAAKLRPEAGTLPPGATRPLPSRRRLRVRPEQGVPGPRRLSPGRCRRGAGSARVPPPAGRWRRRLRAGGGAVRCGCQCRRGAAGSSESAAAAAVVAAAATRSVAAPMASSSGGGR